MVLEMPRIFQSHPETSKNRVFFELVPQVVFSEEVVPKVEKDVNNPG
jgi:hypothetical protein